MPTPKDTVPAVPKWRFHWVLCAFIAIAGVLLFLEHRAHLLGALPFLLLLACPLLHFFMHGGHGGQAGHGQAHGARPPGEDK
ncbi:MAG: DUF2933 domain-containing protein [Pseudomonadota bacterium]